MEGYGIWYIEYPFYSLDLNPIEDIWNRIKRVLRKEFLELYLSIETEVNKRRIGEILIEFWNRIPQDFIDGLIDSMPKCLKAIIKPKG